MTKQLVDALLADPVATARVETFIKTYPKVKDITDSAIENILKIYSDQNNTANMYILNLTYYSIKFSTSITVTYTFRKKLSDVLINRNQNIRFNALWSFTDLPFEDVPLPTLRKIAFKNVVAAFQKKGRVTSSSRANIADNKLSLAAFRKSTTKISGTDAEYYLEKVRSFKLTQDEYFEHIMSVTKPTKKLRYHLVNNYYDFTQLNNDLFNTSITAKYTILSHYDLKTYARLNNLLVPTIITTTEESKINAPITNFIDKTIKLDQFNTELWLSYLLIVNHALQSYPNHKPFIDAKNTLEFGLNNNADTEVIKTFNQSFRDIKNMPIDTFGTLQENDHE